MAAVYGWTQEEPSCILQAEKYNSELVAAELSLRKSQVFLGSNLDTERHLLGKWKLMSLQLSLIMIVCIYKLKMQKYFFFLNLDSISQCIVDCFLMCGHWLQIHRPLSGATKSEFSLLRILLLLPSLRNSVFL